MRRTLAAIFALALIAALPTAAHAGGWAHAGLSSTPKGVEAGDTWVVDMTVKQHGVTPLDGVEPAVIVTRPDGTEERFPATPTGEPGVYRAEVLFREPGRYDYRTDDGFGNAFPVDYRPVTVAAAPAPAPASATGDGGFPLVIVPLAILAAAAAVAASRILAGARARRAAASSASRL